MFSRLIIIKKFNELEESSEIEDLKYQELEERSEIEDLKEHFEGEAQGSEHLEQRKIRNIQALVEKVSGKIDNVSNQMWYTNYFVKIELTRLKEDNKDMRSQLNTMKQKIKLMDWTIQDTKSGLEKQMKAKGDRTNKIYNQERAAYIAKLQSYYKQVVELLTKRNFLKDEELKETIIRAAGAKDWNSLLDRGILKLMKRGIVQLPTCIDQFSNLRELNLDDNGLRILPDSIGQLKQLADLSLGNNRLLGIPFSVFKLPLKSLNLSGNLLIEVPFAICSLKQLQFLALNGNIYNELAEGILRSLTNLVELGLERTELRHLPNDIGSLVNLRWLSLRDTKLLSLPQTFPELQNLRWLSLTVSAESTLTLATLPAQLPKIKKLKLQYQKAATRQESQEFRLLCEQREITSSYWMEKV